MHKQATCKCQSSMLQENKPDAARMYVHTFFDTYSDRHVLGLLLCAGVIALWCVVLCCARGSDTQRRHKQASCATVAKKRKKELESAPTKSDQMYQRPYIAWGARAWSARAWGTRAWGARAWGTRAWGTSARRG